MGLLSRVLGGKPGETAINETVRDSVGVLPGVTGHDITYRHGPTGTGLVSGSVEVADLPRYLDVLLRIHGVLGGLLGSGATDVSYDVVAQLPDGTTRTPGEIGLAQPTTGREIGERLA
ncbi:MAG: hypothetical protein WB767_05345 [Nocardioides sp.]